MGRDSIGYIYSSQDQLFGSRDVVGFGSEEWYVKEINKTESNKIIISNHYSGKVCSDSITHIHLGCFINGSLIGVLQFGYAMNPQSMTSVVKESKLDGYKELNRMWFDDKAPKNTASKAISYSIKYIKRKYKTVKWIQSFADQRCGKFGVVYQSANFRYFGEHDADFYSIDGVMYHKSRITLDEKLIRGKKGNRYLPLEMSKRAIKESYRQFRYIYFIDKRELKKCLYKEYQYPKHYNDTGQMKRKKINGRS